MEQTLSLTLCCGKMMVKKKDERGRADEDLETINVALREGCTNQNPEKVWSFAKPGGGGSRRVVKCQTSILEKYFFS